MSHKYNLIMDYSNPKNNKIMIKNKKGMTDPAFQSNQTLKQYINKKLTSYEEQEINKYSPFQSLLNYNEKNNKKRTNNRNNKNNKNFIFKENSFYSRTLIHNLSNYNNVSLNNFKKKQSKKNQRNNSNNDKATNDFFVFKSTNNYNSNNNNISKNKLLNKNKKGINIEDPKANKFFDIIITPNNNNNKKEDSKTSPLNIFNKTKGIYHRKTVLLNKSYKSFSRDLTSFKEKEIKYKSPDNKYATKLKKEINNILISKPLNKTYFKENSKKQKYYYNNLLDNNNNNNFDYFNNDKNENKDNYNESLNESQCPEPTPYVKKYSDIKEIGKENISQSDINIMNNFHFNQNLNDLKEPEEEKNVPLPVSKIHNNKWGNKIIKFTHMNRNNFN